MPSYRVDDSDIIDAERGQATPELEDRVREAMESNPDLAALHNLWIEVLPALENEKAHLNDITARACHRVMERIRDEKSREPRAFLGGIRRPTPQKRFGRFGWKTAAATMSTAACMILFVGYSFLSSDTDPIPTGYAPIATEPHPAEAPLQITQNTTVFVRPGGGMSSSIGTESQPFKSLTEAVSAVSVGGTIKIESGVMSLSTSGSFRLTKPVRIEALGGVVRIARAADRS